jgi:glyoxylase-like metal-dependent hydrolase (beta-lactamase superfamily II)
MKITPLTANTFASDGGAMFGLVPKGIWKRITPVDDHNRIPQRANVLLIETDDRKFGLVDTGCGDPAWFSDKERDLHQLEEQWLLSSALQEQHLSFGDIDFILLSHAHWDHAGGLLTPEGEPVFPHAEIFLRQAEVECATGGDPLLFKSYPDKIQKTFEILADRVFPVPDVEPEVLPGIYMLPAEGHSEGQSSIYFTATELAGREGNLFSALFTGDNCPSQHHLRMVFQTAYDTYPLKTRAWKQKWFPRCVADEVLLLFTHDPFTYGAWIEEDAKTEYSVTKCYLGEL